MFTGTIVCLYMDLPYYTSLVLHAISLTNNVSEMDFRVQSVQKKGTQQTVTVHTEAMHLWCIAAMGTSVH